MGEALRGKVLTTYVLAEAQDRYQVIFSLGELAHWATRQYLWPIKRTGSLYLEKTAASVSSLRATSAALDPLEC
jgi:hypothetical protein